MDDKQLKDISMNCTCFHLRQAARAVTQVYDEALTPVGLRATQFTLLVALTRMQVPTISELSKALVMDRTTLTRNLKPMENEGLIATQSGQDKRTRQMKISAKGKRVLEKALPLWQNVQDKTKKQLGKGQWSRLMGHLKSTVTALNPY